ncbi:MAG TPA: phosphatase PAP2 family protein [Solimonas sp.]|nr:phosphatase PAP2 family protein [Solimonas sp.]
MTRARFWLQYGLLPTLGVLALGGAIVWFGVDQAVADRLYGLEGGSFAARDTFWARRLLHDGGTHLLVALAVGLLATVVSNWRQQRRAAGYLLLCLALGPALAGAGKTFSSRDCPWDQARYGGDKPQIGWLQARPAGLAPGHCFPGAHSAGAWSLFGLFFLWRRRHPRRAWLALAGTLALGLVYAGTQWLRGAHFVSHDLGSAWLCWMTCLLLYAAVFRGSLSGEFHAAAQTQPASPTVPAAA